MLLHTAMLLNIDTKRTQYHVYNQTYMQYQTSALHIKVKQISTDKVGFDHLCTKLHCSNKESNLFQLFTDEKRRKLSL